MEGIIAQLCGITITQGDQERDYAVWKKDCMTRIASLCWMMSGTEMHCLAWQDGIFTHYLADGFGIYHLTIYDPIPIILSAHNLGGQRM